MSSIMSTRIGRKASLVCLSILLSGWSSVWAQESPSRFESAIASQSQSALSDRQALYVVVACPAGELTDLYPAYLFAVDREAKRVKVVQEIFDAASGTAWVRPYYEQGLVIVADTIYGISIIPKDGKRTRRYRIIDMKAPDKLKEVTFAFPASQSIVEEHFLPDQQRGNAIVIKLGSFKGIVPLTGLRLDGTVVQLDSSVYGQVRVSGIPLDGTFGEDFLSLYCSESNFFQIRLFGQRMDSDWRLPPTLKMEESDRAALYVNNRDMLALAPIGERVRRSEGLGSTKVYILDRRSRSWREVLFTGGSTTFRGFGPWLAAHVADKKRPGGNPGRADRRPGFSKYGRPADNGFDYWERYLPGILQLYDLRSGKLYTIKTGQADSEILLVENDTVYYRVHEALYQAPIGTDAVGTPKLLAKDEAIGHAHWAFRGPKVETKDE